jgi:hypothetical protein
MLVWEESCIRQRMRAPTSGDARIRERFIREGIIREKGRQLAAAREGDSALTGAGSVDAVIEIFKSLVRTYSSRSTSNSYAMLMRASMELQLKEYVEETQGATNDSAPSPWAALVNALNMKRLAWTAVTAVSGGQASWRVSRTGKVVGFFSSLKVDGRNTP